MGFNIATDRGYIARDRGVVFFFCYHRFLTSGAAHDKLIRPLLPSRVVYVASPVDMVC